MIVAIVNLKGGVGKSTTAIYFATVASGHAGESIDTLVISLTNPQTDCCDNPIGLDNIAIAK